ncbi:metallophosphoesterase [Virgibacillus sp. W0430]|uniref:metallophosphoesterase n=1 Tax=Virgibacillus sp. W0430 TaxID=3391580 RepID=UPI003F46C942
MIEFVIVFVLFLVLLLVYMYCKAHDDEVDFLTIYDKDVPIDFDGITILFIADIHRRTIKQGTLDKISNQIDFVLIGGDLTERGVPFRRTKSNINKLKKWKTPIFFVMGNNDYEVLPGEFESLLQNEGVIVLKNTFIRLDKASSSLYLYGFDYNPSNEHVSSVHWDDQITAFRVLLTHTPRSFYELPYAYQEMFNIVLAGHTHGGQIRLGRLGFYSRGGIEKQRNTNVLISEGYGYSLLPLRLQTRAECHVLKIKRELNNTSSKTT